MVALSLTDRFSRTFSDRFVILGYFNSTLLDSFSHLLDNVMDTDTHGNMIFGKLLHQSRQWAFGCAVVRSSQLNPT